MVLLHTGDCVCESNRVYIQGVCVCVSVCLSVSPSGGLSVYPTRVSVCELENRIDVSSSVGQSQHCIHVLYSMFHSVYVM